MPQTIKLSEWERETLREKTEELNRVIREMKGKEIQVSTLVHEILEAGIKRVSIDERGNIILQ